MSLKFDMTQIEGDWLRFESNTAMVESWTKDGDGKWRASSVARDSSGQVVFSETVALEKRNGVWNYCVVAQGQNDNTEICFALIKSSRKKMVFENRAHDFPKAISYTLEKKNHIHAYVEGLDENGKTVRVNFEFNRR